MATLKGIFPNPKPTRRKNFIHENVKNLRRMEQFFHTKDLEDPRKMLPQKKTTDKYRDVGSRINSSLRKHNPLGKLALRHSDKNLSEDDRRRPERKLSAPAESKKPPERGDQTRQCPKSKSPDKRPKAVRTETDESFEKDTIGNELPRDAISRNEERVRCRHQGIQTLDTSDMEALYSQGAIRYPSSRSSKKATSPSREDAERSSPVSDPRDTPSPRCYRRDASFERADASPVNGEQNDHAKNTNKSRTATVASKFATQLNNGVLPSNYRKGVVPKYIRERKEAQQQRDEKLKAAATHPDCPDGHVPLPDDERKETLRMLKKHHQEYVSELNMMPIKTDTLRSQRRKMEIEKQLTKLEEGIKVFSRPRVYVKINA